MKNINKMTMNECVFELFGLHEWPWSQGDDTLAYLTTQKITAYPEDRGWFTDRVGWNRVDKTWAASAVKKAAPGECATSGNPIQWHRRSVDGFEEDGDSWVGAMDSELLARARLAVLIKRFEEALTGAKA